jgi:hypothetical protein
VLTDTAASFPDFVTEANRLRGELPPDVEATLKRHEDAGTTDDPGYEEACMVFYQRTFVASIRSRRSWSRASNGSRVTRPSTTR